MHPDCEAFSLGNEASKTFNSPGYPGHYTKNISCVRVLTGEKQKQFQLLISPGRLGLNAVHSRDVRLVRGKTDFLVMFKNTVPVLENKLLICYMDVHIDVPAKVKHVVVMLL